MTPPRGLVVLLGTASTVVVVAGMKAAAWLLAPTLLALVIPPALVALRSGGWQLALTVVGVYVAINFVLQSLVQPLRR